jgi:hypothetical protein
MSKPVLVGILIVVLILLVLVYSSYNLRKFHVEVCMTFHGQTNCRTAFGTTESFAQRAATTNACATIASGVTDSIACENTPPTKVTWK